MADLGNKHECLGCGTKFYDLGKKELVCPKCGANQKELTDEKIAGKTATRKTKKTTSKKTKRKTAKKAGKDSDKG